jgi:hypothetical protein
VDARFPNKSPESLLDDWSGIILKDFNNARNPETPQATPKMVSQATVLLNQQSQLMMQMNATILDNKRQQDIGRRNMESQQRTMSAFDDKFAHLQGEMNAAYGRLAVVTSVFRTPPNAGATTRWRSHAEVDGQPGDISRGGGNTRPRLEDTAEAVLGTTAQSGMARAAQALEQTPALVRQLVYGAEARALLAEGSSNKNMYISTVLQDLTCPKVVT